ncbi:MAG: hypothetical protein OXT74_12560 [Candidatus Poribacteria bacterium]|nr:hypothetical protein [Candidatus Poribacteria bacterium]
MNYCHYIGIDYSGASTPETRLKGLQVYGARSGRVPERAATPTPSARNWTRAEIGQYCADTITTNQRVIIGIDHAFSFPRSYMDRYELETWDRFLDDFTLHWPTANPQVTVESLRNGNPRTGDTTEFRMCESWTASAKSVFRFDVQGQVAKSTHAGLPWLRHLRRLPNIRKRVHFWPFDGFDIPDSKSVIAEVYPSLFRNRYPKESRTSDEHDAYATARWLAEMDCRGHLGRYFKPPLTPYEAKLARIEGWILGVS